MDSGKTSSLKAILKELIVSTEEPNTETSEYLLFEMAVMPFPCNGIVLFQGNFPRVIQVFTLKMAKVHHYYASFLSPFSIF